MMLVNDVELCVETFGEAADPAILLVGASMLTWDEEFCRRLAEGGRHAIRYDLRDTGQSVSGEPYSMRDLVADAVALLDRFGLPAAHVVGFSVGGWIAQRMALDHPQRVASLTLIATRPTAPGPSDPDLPDHSPEIMDFVRNTPEPDWSDRAAVIDYLVERDRRLAGSLPFDEDRRRAVAARIVDRTADVRLSLTSLAFIRHGKRWRERLGQITAPTLLLHGTEDPFFPYGNGAALAAEIPGARLIPLDGAGHELPPDVWNTAIPAILDHTAGSALD